MPTGQIDMSKSQDIPLHHFFDDDASSIPFQLIPLARKTHYDTSVAHRHNYYEIFVFTEGGGTHNIDFEDFNIASNSIHYVSPGQVHHVNRALDSSGYVILFSREFYYLNMQDKNLLFELPFLNNNSKQPVLNISADAFAQLLFVIQSMERECSSNLPLNEDILRSYLNILLLECKRNFDVLHPDVAVAHQNSTYQQFKVLLETHFIQKHKVSDYASLLHITEKHLNEVCKKAVGKKASEIIYERIILESKRLLLHSDYSNKEIAFFLHFDDPSHFNKFFKNKVGITPSSFKKEKSLS